MRFFSLLVPIFLLGIAPSLAEHHTESTESVEKPASEAPKNDIEIVKITDKMYVLVSPMGGNVLVSSGQNGIFLVDDQLDGQSELIEEAIQNFSDKPIKFIVNTHYHFDHTGGNENFGAKDSIIVAHNNVRERLSTKQVITFFDKQMEPLSESGLPVITFSNDISFHYNSDDIDVIHVPNAHTDGDVVVYFKKQNVIAAGDTIFNGMYPFVDVEHGGSILGVVSALDVITKIANEKTVIVPGHGAIMNKQDAQTYRDMLAIIANRIDSLAKAGKTLEQVLEQKPTAEFDETHGNGIVGPDAFVGILYEDLKPKKH